MKRLCFFKRYTLLYLLIMCRPMFAHDQSTDITLPTGVYPEQVHHAIVHLEDDIIQTILQCKQLFPDQQWSLMFNLVCQDLITGGNNLYDEQIAQIIKECVATRTKNPHTAATEIVQEMFDILDEYNQKLQSGNAYTYTVKKSAQKNSTAPSEKLCTLSINTLDKARLHARPGSTVNPDLTITVADIAPLLESRTVDAQTLARLTIRNTESFSQMPTICPD